MRSKISKKNGKAKGSRTFSMMEMLENRELLSTTWYVSTSGSDSAAGTSSGASLQTIQAAINKAAAGDTIDVAAGTYNGALSVNKANLTIQGINGKASIVAPINNSSINMAVDLGLNASGTTLNNLDISGGYYYAVKTESTYDTGAASNYGTSHVTIENCTLHDSGQDVVKLTPGSNYVTIENSEIYNSGRRDPSNAEGIDAVNADYAIVQGNTIHDTTTNGIYFKGGSVDTLIQRNTVYNIGYSGIILGQDSDWQWFDLSTNPKTYESIDGVVRNNVVYNTQGAGVMAWAADGAQIYNNTLSNVAQSMFGGIAVVGDDHYPLSGGMIHVASNNVTIKNNSVNGTGARPSVYIATGGLTGSFTSSNNRYYNTNGSAPTFEDDDAGIYGASLATWQSKMGDSGSSVGNPGLDGNLVPTASSPLVNAGANLGSLVPDDFLGNKRPSGGTDDIGAYEYGATGGSPSNFLDLGGNTISSTSQSSTSNPSQSSSGSSATSGSSGSSSTTFTPAWQNNSISNLTGTFVVDFDATPAANNSDFVLGLSNGTASAVTSLGPIVRFNTNGTIDARNGGAYAAQNTMSYSAGQTYHFEMVVNMANHSYNVYVTPAGGSTTTLASGYAFRTEQSGMTQANDWATYNEVGDATIANFATTVAAPPLTSSTGTVGSTGTGTTTTTGGTTATPSWLGSSISPQTGNFTMDFDFTPTQAAEDTVIGLSSGQPSSLNDLAVAARFNSDGTIDALNGSTYSAVNTFTYTPGVMYHFTFVVNVQNHNYNVYVNQAGGPRVLIATNYAFRTSQASVSQLGYWSKYNTTGDAQLNGAALNSAFVGNGNGLTGTYFDGTTLSQQVLTKIDPSLNFNNKSGALAKGVNGDNFSVRWTGTVQPEYSQTYTFYDKSDGGARVWVNGQLLIDNWSNHQKANEQAGSINLVAGVKYSIKVEYYDTTGGATQQLSWSSPSTPKQIIPTSQLYSV